MKREFKKLLIFSLVLLGLSGCVKFNTTMDIKKDKSMDYSIIYGMSSTLIEDQQILSDEEKKELESKGFKAEDYKDNKYTGIKLTISFDNIDDVSTDNDTEFSLSNVANKSEKLENIFKVKKGLLKNTYTANFKFDQSDSGITDTSMDDDDSYDVQSAPTTAIDSLSSSEYDTFKIDVENIYKQASTKFASDSLTAATAETYCNSNACTTPNETGVSTTNNYIVKLDKTGKITYICVWNDSYIYEKKGSNIKITDINDDIVKENSNVVITKYTAATASAKEIPFAVTPTYQSLQTVEEENDDSIFEDSMMETMMTSIDLKYIVNLPYKAVSSNATEKSNDDKTLTWDLTSLKENDNVKFEFYIYNTTNILIGSGIIVVIIVIIILLIVKSKKSKKDKIEPINNTETNNNVQTQSQNTETNNNIQTQSQNTETVINEPTISPETNSVSNEVNDSINSVVGMTEESNQPETVTPAESIVSNVTAPIVDAPIVDTPVTEAVVPQTSTVAETIQTIETPTDAPIVETQSPVVENTTPVIPVPMVEQVPTEQVVNVPEISTVTPVQPISEDKPVASVETITAPVTSEFQIETSTQTEQQNIIQ